MSAIKITVAGPPVRAAAIAALIQRALQAELIEPVMRDKNPEYIAPEALRALIRLIRDDEQPEIGLHDTDRETEMDRRQRELGYNYVAPGCCSSVQPCNHQKRWPSTLCPTCETTAKSRENDLAHRFEQDHRAHEATLRGPAALASRVGAALDKSTTGSSYFYREIGEGEGWKPCSKAFHDHVQKDPTIDTKIEGGAS